MFLSFFVLRFEKKGFTLVELLLIIGILIVLIALAFPAFRYFQKESDLNNSAEEIINTLRLAQNKTLASEEDSQWGIYFSTSTDPHQYTLFKGANFISRATSSDEIQKLPKSVEIYEINLVSGGSEVVFNRVRGETNQFGQVSIRLKTDPTKTKTIYIENSGQVGLTSAGTISDESRIKDSRHVHFDYSRYIATSTEKLILTFTYNTSTLIKEIIIAENLKDDQIYWEEEVDVGGSIQKLKIHTHRLNDLNLGTQFCIHRDRRYNNKALKIDIDDTPDPDPGTLIEYSASGEESRGTSIYLIGNPTRQ